MKGQVPATMRRTTCKHQRRHHLVDGGVLVGQVQGRRAVHVRRSGRHRRQQVGPLHRGRGQQVAGLAGEGLFVPKVPVGDVAYKDLTPVGVVARVDEPPARVARQGLRHRPAGGGIVGAADEQGVPSGGKAGVAALILSRVLLPEGVHRVQV